MQAAKNAMASVKETAANIGASAQSGMEKTKATVQEKVTSSLKIYPVSITFRGIFFFFKFEYVILIVTTNHLHHLTQVEKLAAQHPAEKEMAEEKKRERIEEAEIEKRQAMEHNAAAAEQARAGHTSGPGGARTAASPVPGEGHLTEGVVRSRPIGMGTGTERPTAAYNPHAESTEPALRGTGGRYT